MPLGVCSVAAVCAAGSVAAAAPSAVESAAAAAPSKASENEKAEKKKAAAKKPEKAAEEKQVVFLDLYSEFANENGELPEEASKDGVHLKSDYCKQWLEYLKVHTVDFETLYPEGTET